MEKLFENEKLYRLSHLERVLGYNRKTFYNWIDHGLIVSFIKADRIIKSRVKLRAEKYGNEYKALGRDITEFFKITGKKK